VPKRSIARRRVTPHAKPITTRCIGYAVACDLHPGRFRWHYMAFAGCDRTCQTCTDARDRSCAGEPHEAPPPRTSAADLLALSEAIAAAPPLPADVLKTVNDAVDNGTIDNADVAARLRALIQP